MVRSPSPGKDGGGGGPGTPHCCGFQYSSTWAKITPTCLRLDLAGKQKNIILKMRYSAGGREGGGDLFQP